MNRSTIIALLVVVVLTIVALVVTRNEPLPDLPELSINGVSLAPPGEADKVKGPVTRIKFFNPSGMGALLHEGALWKLEEGGHPANSALVDAMLKAFARPAVSGSAIEVPPEGLDDYGLSPDLRIPVTIYGPDGVLVNLWIGFSDEDKVSGEKSTFVMEPDSNVVFRIVGVNYRTPLEIPVSSLRDKALFHFKKEDAQRLEILDPRHKGARVVMERVQDKWNTVEPKDKPMDPPDSYLSAILDTRAAEFLPKLPDADKSALDKAFVITVEIKNGDSSQTHVLELGAPRGGKVYARLDRKEDFLMVDSATSKKLMKSLNDLRTKKLVNFHSSDLDHIELTIPGQPHMALDRIRDDEWRFTAPKEELVDETAARGLASGVATFVVMRFLDSQPDLETAGLSRGYAIIKAHMKGETGEGTVEMHIGAAFLEDGKQTGYYARFPTQSDEVFLISTTTAHRIMKTFEELKDKRVLRLKPEEIASIALEHPDQTLVFEPIPGAKTLSWQMTKPEAISPVNLSSLVFNLTHLDALDVTQGIPPESAGFGPDSITVRVKTHAGQEFSFQLSESEGEKGNYVRTNSVDRLKNSWFMVDKHRASNFFKKLPDFKK